MGNTHGACCEREAERGWVPDCCFEELDKGDKLLIVRSGSLHLPAHRRGHAFTRSARDALQEEKEHWAVERVAITADLTTASERLQRVQNEIRECKTEIRQLTDQRSTRDSRQLLAVARAKLAGRMKHLEDETKLHDSMIAKFVSFPPFWHDMRVLVPADFAPRGGESECMWESAGGLIVGRAGLQRRGKI